MMRSLILIVILLALATTVTAREPKIEGVEMSTRWKITRTTVKRANKVKEATGYMMYTVTPDALDAAFRCQKGRLFAFVAIKPVHMRDATKLGWQAKRWYLKVAIGDGEFRDEVWASVHNGKVLMARKRSTSREIFDAARKGTSIRIDPRYGEDVLVKIPADADQVFRRFEEVCGFVAPQPNGPITTT